MFFAFLILFITDGKTVLVANDSNIYNLTSGEVYGYNRADFMRKVKFNLAAELDKGRHLASIPSLFK